MIFPYLVDCSGGIVTGYIVGLGKDVLVIDGVGDDLLPDGGQKAHLLILALLHLLLTLFTHLLHAGVYILHLTPGEKNDHPGLGGKMSECQWKKRGEKQQKNRRKKRREREFCLQNFWQYRYIFYDQGFMREGEKDNKK